MSAGNGGVFAVDLVALWLTEFDDDDDVDEVFTIG